jgi:acetylornithine deacetylase
MTGRSALAPAVKTIELIERLIAFDTTSRHSNLELIGWVHDYLSDLGVSSTLQFDASKSKANLYAVIGPTDKPGLMLAGHTDVVPVDGQDWSTNPWQADRRDHRLYGRGSADMKSFIAVVLAAVPQFLAKPLSVPVHLAFTYDEEVGCFGAARLVQALPDMKTPPKMCIIGEPTEMRVVAAHKGKRNFRCQVRGKECHSSLPDLGVNAIQVAAEIISYLNRMGAEFRKLGPFDADFTPPFTTVHTGTIRGGSALNIVPRDCDFEFEFRHLPADNPDQLFKRLKSHVESELAPAMRRVDPQAGVEFAATGDLPAMSTPEDSEIALLAKRLTGANRLTKVSFGTEGGYYSAAGIPTVICGPGSIEQAHKPDEFIVLEQVALCEAFVARLVAYAQDGN